MNIDDYNKIIRTKSKSIFIVFFYVCYNFEEQPTMFKKNPTAFNDYPTAFNE